MHHVIGSKLPRISLRSILDRAFMRYQGDPAPTNIKELQTAVETVWLDIYPKDYGIDFALNCCILPGYR